MCFVNFLATQQNKTLHHVRRSSVDDSFFKNQKQDAYRSYQPVSIKYHKATYPRADQRTDYDITSYDTEYGGVVSNFTSSIYDDNPPLYPNPEEFSKNLAIKMDNKGENEIELPDDSLADADLKEHNIIDSVTYLYGFSNCHGPRNEYIILIFVNTAISSLTVLGSLLWIILSEYAAKFRQESKLYPIVVNLCCSFIVCMMIYVKAISGSSSPAVCEKIALLLHYTYLTCSTWIVTMAAALTEYCAYNSIMPLKYNYLFAYGVPAFIVMFNYALSMEQYEIKHYCWMSLEKGMVMGFMVPAMLLIIVNTGIILLGLQVVNRKQSESLQTRLQELFERHEASFRKNETADPNVRNENGDALDSIYIAGTSRKNTDSSETLDKDYDAGDDNCYVNIGLPNEGSPEEGIEPNCSDKDGQDQGSATVDGEPLWMKFNWGTEGNELKTYLNLCLVLEPFFAINWVMGVAAIENAGHWTTPTIYLVLALTMYAYFCATICTNLPMLVNKKPVSTCCEEIVGEPALAPIRTTDSIPLLDPAVQQPNGTPAPADTISTISI
ncbi:adhesion G protein-coupled receptor L4-like [Battus philenor]|uniref:adhesion G protein-coupled receptor L4-like n=1 Tax=Battus philenor TaxID=42288 RepID=UPI0035CF30B7